MEIVMVNFKFTEIVSWWSYWELVNNGLGNGFGGGHAQNTRYYVILYKHT